MIGYCGHWSSRVTVAGNDDDVLTIAELKERARIIPGDEESDELMQSFITAARQQVERDTGLALPTQTMEVQYTTPPFAGDVLLVPWPPLQTLDSMVDVDGTPIDVTGVFVNAVAMPARVFGEGMTSRIGLTMTVTVGYTKETLPPLLKFAVGLLAAHYLTTGRDRTIVGTIVADMPAGYEEAIQAYRLEVLV